MHKTTVLFCGSFLENSAQVLAGLLRDDRCTVVGVVTTPPAIIKHQAHPNPVQVVAEKNSLDVFTPELLSETALAELTRQIGRSDVLLTAGYGKLLPENWLNWPAKAALNLHFSALPKYRGANPAEWALLFGETETGITLIEMSPEFDTGKMVAQSLIALDPDDTRETVYRKLYGLGGDVVGEMIAQYLAPDGSTTMQIAGRHVSWWHPPVEQPSSPTPYAKRLTREDGFVAWDSVTKIMDGQLGQTTGFSPVVQKIIEKNNLQPDAIFLERMIRALAGFPGVWTIVPTSKGDKRLKLLAAQVMTPRLELNQVQLEGQQPALWNQVKNVVSLE